MMTSNRPRMAVRAVLATVGIVAALAAITHPWKALSQSAQPVIPLVNGTPGGTVANPFNIAGSFSASISGFAFNGSYGTLTATASSSGSTALPTGTDVIFHNTSSVAVSCVIATGAATATTNKIIIEGNSWIQVTVGSNVNTACINQTGSASNVVALAGGAGIATGAGGGGSGSGGAVTIASGGVASGAYASGALASGSVASGAMVDLGAIADAAATAGSTGTVNAKLRLMTSQLDSINTNIQAGAGATGASAPASAIYTGCRGQNAEATAVTNGQLVGEACDLVGKQISLPYANPENFVSGGTSAMTGTTSTSVIASAGGSLRNYITACTFSNSHATVGTMILLQDGSGGTTLWSAPAAAVFGGAHVVFPTPIKTTAATALFTANVTTGANTFVFCTGYKGL